MITQIAGTLIEKSPTQAIIDAHGIGYEIDISMHTFTRLPDIGANARLFTQFIVREDAHLLFGFFHKSERETFRQLIKINGIGAKIALGILSAMQPEELAQTIAQDDIKRLCTIPGIGKKTAERMILELRGKLSPAESGLFAPPVSGSQNDIISTLLALGYHEREARAATKNIDTNDISEGVRQALKNLTAK